jgi:hypothetical protein
MMRIRTTCKQICAFRGLTAPAFVVATLLATAAHADLTLSNRTVTASMHIYTVDDMGLPAQLEIRAAANDIPLAFRSQKAPLPAALLRRIGRGPQLAGPMRIEAVIDKATVVVKADAPATLQKTDAGVEAASTWQAGALKGRLSLMYADNGVMTGQLIYDSKGVELERLDLVLEISGSVDTAIAGNPADAVSGKPLPMNYGSIDPDPGMLWINGPTPSGDGSLQKGRLSHFFLGNGDRGFTWLTQAGDDTAITDKEPSMSVERKPDGIMIWRIALANKSPRSGERTAAFTLLTHPSRRAAPGRRYEQWQPWNETAAVSPLNAAACGTLTGSNLLVRADAGSVQETAAARALLTGAAGGEAHSIAATLADRFPIGLFRYLSGRHTALGAQVRTDAATLTTSGASPAPDRMALGRALLHDIGVDVSSLANPVEAARVVQALEEFGYFRDDGQTEFLPYWRTASLLRFGEESQAKNGFAVETEDPSARVRVSAFIRPDGILKGEGPKRKTLFVIVNEGTNDVRGQLYVQQPTYLFGGFNKTYVHDIYARLDFSRIPGDGDWSSGRVMLTVPSWISPNTKVNLKKGMNPAVVVPPLMDLESGSYVRLVEHGDPTKKYGPAYAVKEFFEVYGPVYVPARGMRLLYGSGNELVRKP